MLPPDVPGIDRVRGWDRKPPRRRGAPGAPPPAAFDTRAGGRLRRAPAPAFLLEAIEAARYLGPYRLANLDRFFRQLLAAVEESGGDAHGHPPRPAPQRRRGARGRGGAAAGGRRGRGRRCSPSTAPRGSTSSTSTSCSSTRPPPRRPPVRAPRRGRSEATAFEFRLFGAPTLGFDQVEAERARGRGRRAGAPALRGDDPRQGPPRPRRRSGPRGRSPDPGTRPAPTSTSSSPAATCPRAPRPLATGLGPEKPRRLVLRRPDRRPLEVPRPAPAGRPRPRRRAASARRSPSRRRSPSSPPPSRAERDRAAARMRPSVRRRRLRGGPRAPPRAAGRAPASEGRRGERGRPPAGRSAPRTAKPPWPPAAPSIAPWRSGTSPPIPAGELDRQRALLPAYLAALVGGDALDRALPRAAEPPGAPSPPAPCSSACATLRTTSSPASCRSSSRRETATHAPVGVVTGAIDLLYRDPEDGRRS